MKLKEILSGMFIVALGVTSCTSEMPVDNQGEDGTSALSVVLSVGDQATKAIDAPAGDGYGIATANEIKINDFHVAIFDGTSNKRISAMTVKPNEAGVEGVTVKVDGKQYSGYKVNFKDVSTRDHNSVYALVIANASDVYKNFTNYTEYSDYEANEEANVTMTAKFDASNLAKSGKSELKLISGNTNIELLVPLTQLSARIDFGTATAVTKAGGDLPHVETMQKDSASVWNVIEKNQCSSSIIDQLENAIKGIQANGTWAPFNEKEQFINFDEYKGDKRDHYNVWESIPNVDGYYYGEQYGGWQSRGSYIARERWRNAYYNNRILLVRKKVTTKEITTTTTTTDIPGSPAGFKIQKVSFSGANGKTKSIFETGHNTVYEGVGGDIAENTSFYTYEFPTTGDQKNLEITLTGYFHDGTQGSTETGTSVEEKILFEKWVYGIWVQSRGSDWNSVPTTPKDDSAGIIWYDGKDGRPEITQEISSTKSVLTVSDNSLKSGENIYTYKFKWSDLKQDGQPVTLQRGYRYLLDVKVDEYNKLQMDITKEAWKTPKPIDVNYGEKDN